MLRPLALLAVLLLAAAPAAAQFGVGDQTSVSDCRSFTTTSSVGVVAAGSVVFCARNPAQIIDSGTTFHLGATITTPTLSGATPSLTLSLNDLTGCSTVGSPVTHGTSPSASWGAQTSTTWELTLTGDSCSGYLRAVVTSGASTVFDSMLAFTMLDAELPAQVQSLTTAEIGGEGMLFALLWVAVCWVMLRRAKGFAAFTALLGLLNEWLTAIMPGSRLGYVLLFVLALWLEAIVGDRLWTRWVGGTKTTESEAT